MPAAAKPTTATAQDLSLDLILKALRLAETARAMSELYDERKDVCARYVHSTSRGHEAVQIATGLQLTEQDLAYPYYRDDSLMLALGMAPAELMAQLAGKAMDPSSGGRTYYCHPSIRRAGMAVVPHQSSATGMQAIPATGAAHGLKYRQDVGLDAADSHRVVVCSIGDGAMTEGEVAEALQMAALKQLPIVYLVQDNEWAISATKEETRTGTAYDYAAGFPGLARLSCDGADFADSYATLQTALKMARKGQPVLVHAPCPLLGHHTSGVRKEWYRTEQNIADHLSQDPLPRLRALALDAGADATLLAAERDAIRAQVAQDLETVLASPGPDPATALQHVLAPTPVTHERGERNPAGSPRTFMVDAALHALDETLSEHPEALFYGQDVGPQLGGVFREASGLSQKFGTHRVFNTPIQEAYIVGSTAGMAAVGLRPIVELQFADYFWPAMNQFVSELSKSCYLSQGQFPIPAVIRVPIGAYGGGGPYHSGSIESALLTIKGIKVCYPSTTADLKGLLKAAWLDPNPVVMLEHKGLYWSKVAGTEEAKTVEPDSDYILPLGKARTVLEAEAEAIRTGTSLGIVTYGMGVYWATAAAKSFSGQLEVLDLRTLAPLDEVAVEALVRRHGRALFLTEEPASTNFLQALAARMTVKCFSALDAPIEVFGAEDTPAVPLNLGLEAAVLPTAEKVRAKVEEMLEG